MTCEEVASALRAAVELNAALLRFAAMLDRFEHEPPARLAWRKPDLVLLEDVAA